MATYGEAQSTYSTPVTIPLSYQSGKNWLLLGIIFWGDVAGEFTVNLNGEVKAGGRTSDQHRTLQLDFTSAPIGINAGDELEVIATHYNSGVRAMKAVVFARAV